MKYPYCSLIACQGYQVCQSPKQIMFRILNDSPEQQELFEMCQQLQTQFELNEKKETIE